VVAGVAAAAFVVVTTSGCGAANTLDPVAKAASISTTIPGFQMRFEVRFGSPQLPTALTATGIGSFDARDRAGSVVFVMNAGNDPQLKNALGGSTLRLDELVDGTTIYVKLPPAIAIKLPGGRPWMKVDLAKASGIRGFSSLANNPVSSDPSQFLSYLRATSGHVSKQGTEVVNGIQTTHYHATINLDRVPDALPSGSRKGAKQAVSSIEQLTGLKQLPVDAWIDSKQPDSADADQLRREPGAVGEAEHRDDDGLRQVRATAQAEVPERRSGQRRKLAFGRGIADAGVRGRQHAGGNVGPCPIACTSPAMTKPTR